MATDRQRARRVYRQARLWLGTSVGFAGATLIYPPRPYVLPSTILAIGAIGAALLCAAVANYWWHRDH